MPDVGGRRTKADKVRPTSPDPDSILIRLDSTRIL